MNQSSEQAYWERVELIATSWLDSLAPAIVQMSGTQLIMLRAISTGEPILRQTSLPINWSMFDDFVRILGECPRFKQMASFGGSLAIVRAEDVPFRLASVCLEHESRTLHSGRFKQAIQELRAFINDDDVQCTLRSELFNFWSDEPVSITDTLAIVPNESEPSLVTLMMWIPQGRYCLEARATVPLVLVDQTAPDKPVIFGNDPGAIAALYNDVELATQVLAVLQKGTFTPGQPELA